MTKSADDDFLKVLQDGVKSVLSNTESKPAEKIEAINAGVGIMKALGKIKPEDTSGGKPNFFKK